MKCWRRLKELFLDYSERSTIHGVNYLGERGRSWFERIWWVASITIAVLCCGKLIFDAWHINPIIISFTGKPLDIWQIPFPSVTICPNVFVRSEYLELNSLDDRFYEGLVTFDDLSEQELDILYATNIICPAKILAGDLENYTNCNKCLETLREFRIPPEIIFFDCTFKKKKINCTESFKEIIIDRTVCYRFNGLEIYRPKVETADEVLSQDWSIDEGYKETAPINVYPHRILGAGQQYGLSIILRIGKSDLDRLCYEPGFWLEFRTPIESAQFSTNFFNILMEESKTFSLKPNMMVTSEGLRSYPVDKRKCYFSNERRLKYFQQYTASNCEIECETLIGLQTCECMRHYFEGHTDVDICGNYQDECLSEVRENLTFHLFSHCDCPPTCSAITFDAEITVTKFNKSAHSKISGIDETEFDYSQISIYFEDNQVMTSERKELYGKTEFLANCGGILGLFLGVSVISIIEIAYFCTIRLYVDLRDRTYHATIFFNELLRPQLRENRRFLKVTKKLLSDYSSKTTIQGINYVGDSDLSVAERIWWSLVVLLSIGCCGLMIFDALERYEESPLLISFANEETPIYEIPYPAITICPQFVFRDVQELYDHFLLKNGSLYSLDSEKFNRVVALAQICDANMFGNIDPDNKTNCDKCPDYLKKMLGDVDEFLTSCSLIFKENCSQMLKEVMTEEGICYTFNGLDVYRDENDVKFHGATEDWTLEDGYKDKTEDSDVFPRKGSKLTLEVYPDVDVELNDGLCKGPIQGFKVYLHLPNEVPLISRHYYLVPFKQNVQINLIPKVIVTQPELRDFSIEKRQCFFSDERYLRFFKYYTQINCEMECVANATLRKCGCLKFFMPKLSGIKFCGISDIRCYQNAVLKDVELQISRTESITDCNCLPACTSISYDAEINQMYMTDDDYAIYREIRGNDKNVSFTAFSSAFKDNQFVALERSQLYGKTELIAQLGGILSLFMGFSFISILELVYFCTVRLLINYIHFE